VYTPSHFGRVLGRPLIHWKPNTLNRRPRIDQNLYCFWISVKGKEIHYAQFRFHRHRVFRSVTQSLWWSIQQITSDENDGLSPLKVNHSPSLTPIWCIRLRAIADYQRPCRHDASSLVASVECDQPEPIRLGSSFVVAGRNCFRLNFSAALGLNHGLCLWPRTCQIPNPTN
jgi:hypothetical protein